MTEIPGQDYVAYWSFFFFFSCSTPWDCILGAYSPLTTMHALQYHTARCRIQGKKKKKKRSALVQAFECCKEKAKNVTGVNWPLLICLRYERDPGLTQLTAYTYTCATVAAEILCCLFLCHSRISRPNLVSAETLLGIPCFLRKCFIMLMLLYYSHASSFSAFIQHPSARPASCYSIFWEGPVSSNFCFSCSAWVQSCHAYAQASAMGYLWASVGAFSIAQYIRSLEQSMIFQGCQQEIDLDELETYLPEFLKKLRNLQSLRYGFVLFPLLGVRLFCFVPCGIALYYCSPW